MILAELKAFYNKNFFTIGMVSFSIIRYSSLLLRSRFLTRLPFRLLLSVTVTVCFLKDLNEWLGN